MTSDDRMYIDSYHHRNTHYTPNNNAPGSTSTQLTNVDLHHHDMIMNSRSKRLDFFDFHNDLEHNDMFYHDYGHQRSNPV